jgi:hypothetical protein
MQPPYPGTGASYYSSSPRSSPPRWEYLWRVSVANPSPSPCPSPSPFPMDLMFDARCRIRPPTRGLWLGTWGWWGPDQRQRQLSATGTGAGAGTATTNRDWDSVSNQHPTQDLWGSRPRLRGCRRLAAFLLFPTLALGLTPQAMRMSPLRGCPRLTRLAGLHWG